MDSSTRGRQQPIAVAAQRAAFSNDARALCHGRAARHLFAFPR